MGFAIFFDIRTTVVTGLILLIDWGGQLSEASARLNRQFHANTTNFTIERSSAGFFAIRKCHEWIRERSCVQKITLQPDLIIQNRSSLSNPFTFTKQINRSNQPQWH